MGSGEAEASSSSSSGRCSVVGRLLFSWFDGYVAMGRARALTADEIPELEEEFRYGLPETAKLRMRGRAETEKRWGCTVWLICSLRGDPFAERGEWGSKN